MFLRNLCICVSLYMTSHPGRSRSSRTLLWEPQKPFGTLRSIICPMLLTTLVKGKAIQLQASTSPKCSRRLRFPDFKTIDTWSGSVGCPAHRPPLTFRKYCWFLFLTESIPGPQCGRKDYVKETLKWHNWESNPRPSCVWSSASTNCATVLYRVRDLFYTF